MGLFQQHRFTLTVTDATGKTRERHLGCLEHVKEFLIDLCNLAEQVEEDSGRPYFRALTLTDAYQEEES